MGSKFWLIFHPLPFPKQLNRSIIVRILFNSIDIAIRLSPMTTDSELMTMGVHSPLLPVTGHLVRDGYQKICRLDFQACANFLVKGKDVNRRDISGIGDSRRLGRNLLLSFSLYPFFSLPSFYSTFYSFIDQFRVVFSNQTIERSKWNIYKYFTIKKK